MERERSLTSVTGQTTQSFSSFLTVYSINLAFRYPDVTNLTTIDQEEIRRVADFCLPCSTIALTTWEEGLSVNVQKQRRVA